MRSWRMSRSGRMVPYYMRKAYRKARFKRMETRAAVQVFRDTQRPIPGFDEDMKMVDRW